MRRALLTVLCALALAGCGGGSAGSVAAGPSGSEIAPADALAFVAIDTDRDSEQWKRADSLLKKFPFRDRLLASIDDALPPGARGALQVAGPEVDVVVVQTAGGPKAVGLAQPSDEQRFDDELAQSDTKLVHKRVDDWTVFSDSQAALDKVTGKGDALESVGAFGDAMAELPDETNAKAYLDGRKLATLMRDRSAAAPVPPGHWEWVSLALSSQERGWKLDGAAKPVDSSGLESFTPTLLDRVPAGSLVVASFKGSTDMFRTLRDAPGAQQGLAQLQPLLGVGFDQLTSLVSDEGVFFVQSSLPIPEATLILKEKDPTRALATLDTLARRSSAIGATFTRGTIRKLALGSVTIRYGADGDTVVISDTTTPFGRHVSSKIADDPVYGKARGDADVPDENAGLLYVNVKDALPLVELFAQLRGAKLPPDVTRGLEPVESLIAFADASRDVTKFSALLQVR